MGERLGEAESQLGTVFRDSRVHEVGARKEPQDDTRSLDKAMRDKQYNNDTGQGVALAESSSKGTTFSHFITHAGYQRMTSLRTASYSCPIAPQVGSLHRD